MPNYARLAFAALLWLFAQPLFAAEPLKLGILPFNSTLALISTHQPLATHLEKALGRPVQLLTAPGYKEFHRQTLAGDFDLVITGPHFGMIALQSGRFEPLARYNTDLQPLLVVGGDSGIERPEQLRGKRIGQSNRLSVSSIGGIAWLEAKGMNYGADYELADRATHGAAVAAVAVGELDGALTTHTPLKQIPADVTAKVKVIPSDIRFPHLMTLARKELGEAEIATLRKALTSFPETPEGRAFFDKSGYKGYVAISEADLQSVRPYLDLVEKLLAE